MNSQLYQTKSFALPYFIFFCGILYYCFAYLLRIYPSVIHEPLVQELNLNAGQYGLLASFYYFAYAPMQIPVGVLVDKYGVRKSLLGACVFSIFGSWLFASSFEYSLVALGRFFVGFGCAFSYVSTLKIATIWLPKRVLATAAGCATSGGMIAAILTNYYFEKSLSYYGFSFTEFIPVWIGLLLFAVIYLFIIEPEQSSDTEGNDHQAAVSFAELWVYLKQIMLSKQIWYIGLVGAFLYIPSSVFLDVWADPYLINVKKLTLFQATLAKNVMLSGWIISSLMTGVISDYFGNRRGPLIVASVISMLMACIILYGPHVQYSVLILMMFLFGVGCGPHPLCFILAKENFDTKVAGTAISFTNFLIMLGGFVFQPVLGYILNWIEPGHVGGLSYSAQSYQIAMSIMPVSLAISIVLVLLIKETYKQ
tara:strand:+ start:2836 stop:4104 length:1269 start_codon:yes stop_codon:yes gene_type:complete